MEKVKNDIEEDIENKIKELNIAISLVKSKRKKIEEETAAINKRILYIKNEEKNCKVLCDKKLDKIHKIKIEMKSNF